MEDSALKNGTSLSEKKHYNVDFENGDTRVIRIEYDRHDRVPMYECVHGVMVFLKRQRVRFKYIDGTSEEIKVEAGDTFWYPQLKHFPENMGNESVELILITQK
jgi:hypothetical protein